MAQGEHPAATSLADRAAEAQKATWVSVAVNLVMTVAQLVVGWLAHSQSLVAHGLHSFSDLLSDFLVIYASRQSAHPADEAHPSGPARRRHPVGIGHPPATHRGLAGRRAVGAVDRHRHRRFQGRPVALPDSR